MGGDGEGEADLHAARIALDRRVQEFVDAGEIDDGIELAVDLAPRHAQNGAVEIDVFAAGELGVEAGADFQQAAHAAVQLDAPAAGRRDPERIFSSVDLPAPLRPMMPTTSPACTSKEISSSAMNSSVRPKAAPSRNWRNGSVIHSPRVWASVVYSSRGRVRLMRNRFERFSTRMAVVFIDCVRVC